MKSNQPNPKGQDAIDELVDDDGVVHDDEAAMREANSKDDPEVREMFEPRDGRSADGSIWLPKITMATIRAMPNRCWDSVFGENGGSYKAAIFTGVANGTKIMENQEKTESFVALTGEFSAIRFGLDGEPDAIFKSDTIFFPIGHLAALSRLERQGSLPFSLEFSSNPRGTTEYSWSYRNLAQLDRNNLSAIDRLIAHSVHASREMTARPQGLLADLRRDPKQVAAD